MSARTPRENGRATGFTAVVRGTIAAGLAIAAWVHGPGPVAVASALAQEEASERGIEVSFLRTWVPEDLTMVDGLANVPLEMLAGGTTGAYRFELAVFDAADAQLYRDSWERRLSPEASAYVESGTSYLLEAFRFGVRPGAYEVELRAYPTDAPDLGRRVRLPLMAFGEQPGSSDLFLATRVEPITEGAGGGSWSVTHAGFGIAAAARTSILSTEPDLFYYLELYGRDGLASRVRVSAEVVSTSAGRVVYETPSTEVAVDEGGIPFTGSIALAGLPPGEYELVIRIRGESGEESRAAAFQMLAPVSEAAIAAVSGYEAEYFASLSDEELEQTFGGVSVLVTDTDRAVFEALPPDAKRRFLTEFFGRQNPSPGEPGNAFLEDYLERVATVRARYGESVGTEERMPWFTDRGRIYLQFGEPQNRVVNYSPADIGGPTSVLGSGGFAGEPPYEIWQYQNTGFVYLFIQDDRFDRWRMIYSNDTRMQSLADWYRRCGPVAKEDLRTNFGINTPFSE